MVNINANQQLSILLIGDVERTEFSEPAQWLAENTNVSTAVDTSIAEDRIRTAGTLPDVIVLAESRPGEFTAESIGRLQRIAPLARMIGLLGSWCEGEPRTCRAAPGVLRTFWYHWSTQMSREFLRFASGTCPTWGLPITATDTERLLHTTSAPLPVGQGLVVVCARDSETCDTLSDACFRMGYSAVCVQPHQPVHVTGSTTVLWDGNAVENSTVEELRELVKRFSPTPVIALLFYPRPEDIETVAAAGVSGILAKPFLVRDLYGEIERLRAADVQVS